MKIGCVISILLLRSKLSSWLSLSICEQNETRKRNHVVIIIFVDYKSFFLIRGLKPQPLQIRSCSQPKCTFSIVSWLSVSLSNLIRQSIMVTKNSTESIQTTEAIKFVVLICNHRTYNLSLNENWLHNLHSVTKVKPE